MRHPRMCLQAMAVKFVKLALAAVGYAEKGLFSSLLASTFGDRFGRMRKKV